CRYVPGGILRQDRQVVRERRFRRLAGRAAAGKAHYLLSRRLASKSCKLAPRPRRIDCGSLMPKKASGSGSRPQRHPALTPPPNAQAYRERADLWRQQGEYQRALADYQKAVKLAPNHPEGYRGRAWILATCPDQHFRNGADAVQDAVRAQRLAGPVPEVVLDN